jgi:peroxiredoxin
MPATDDFPTGPSLGERFPDATLRNQRNELVKLHEARAGRRALIVFQRSARWCAFCRTQLVEMQRGLTDFEAAGIWVVAISNDPVGDLAQFCDEHDIEFTFLSDAGSDLIRRLGILNTLIEPDEAIHGIPFPGTYLLDEAGVVVGKYFHREYQVREAPAFVLAEGFGLAPNLDGFPREEVEAEGVRLEVTLGAPDLKLRQRVFLHVRLMPREGWEIEGEPAIAVDPGDEIEVRATRYDSGANEARVELLSEARDVESVPLDIDVTCALRSPDGERVERSLSVRMQLPVGDLNRAPRA